jgi:hypothetical protein
MVKRNREEDAVEYRIRVEPIEIVFKNTVCNTPAESSNDIQILLEVFNGGSVVLKYPDAGSNDDVVYL